MSLNTWKERALSLAEKLDLFQAAYRSQWRSERLLILAYHGVSLSDEHNWNPQLYMSAEHLASRFQRMKADGCNVLPLDEAIRRMYDGTLPGKSVALTFDDGFHDFHERALPVLQHFSYPATLYLTTYYADREMPVFPLICGYIAWRARGGGEYKGWQDKRLPAHLDLRTPASRAALVTVLHRFADQAALSAEERDSLAAQLANLAGVDYEEIRHKRVLHLLNRAEVRSVADAGIHVELHTHRHRSPTERDSFVRELSQNAASIERLTNREPAHFCYPSGVHWPQHLPWLRELRILSGVTCRPGLASPSHDPLLLPRVVDGSQLSGLEFQAWLSGAAALFPRRARKEFIPENGVAQATAFQNIAVSHQV